MLVLNKRAEISIALIEDTEVLDFLLVTLLQSKCDSLTHYSIWEKHINLIIVITVHYHMHEVLDV